MCWTLTALEASVLLTMASDIHPPLPSTHRHSKRERERGRGEGEMHPTLELVYTQRICNYSVCLKCPKFLCKMEHLNRHHASAPATNCSAHQPRTEFVKFISLRLVVCVFSIHSFLGALQFWPLTCFCGLEWPRSILRVCSDPTKKNNNNLVFNLQSLTLSSPLHFNCIHQI